jgi:Cytochrome oxidase complex assembly protein 1
MSQGEKKGCFGCSWLVVIPVGCLGVLLLGVAFVAVIVAGVFGVLKSSDVYKEALSRAQANPAVTEALGTPVEAGFLLTGSINVSNGGGDADISIPISGPQGKATIHAVAVKESGTWVYSVLEVTVEGTGESIDLLGEEASARDTARPALFALFACG